MLLSTNPIGATSWSMNPGRSPRRRAARRRGRQETPLTPGARGRVHHPGDRRDPGVPAVTGRVAAPSVRTLNATAAIDRLRLGQRVHVQPVPDTNACPLSCELGLGRVADVGPVDGQRVEAGSVTVTTCARRRRRGWRGRRGGDGGDRGSGDVVELGRGGACSQPQPAGRTSGPGGVAANGPSAAGGSCRRARAVGVGHLPGPGRCRWWVLTANTPVVGSGAQVGARRRAG